MHKRLSEVADAKKQSEKDRKLKAREAVKAKLAKLKGVEKLKKASRKALSALRLAKMKPSTGAESEAAAGPDKVASLFGAASLLTKARPISNAEVPADTPDVIDGATPQSLLAATVSAVQNVVRSDPRTAATSDHEID